MTSHQEYHESGKPPRLRISTCGPRVGSARLSVNDLAQIVSSTQQALKRIGRVLYGAKESRRQGRDRADIAKMCELFLVGWQEGSAVAELELGDTPAQQSLFGYIGEQSVKTFVSGMRVIATSDDVKSFNSLPSGFDRGVLNACQLLANVLDNGIETIDFEASNGILKEQCTLDIGLRNRIQDLLDLPTHLSKRTLTGRLEELNGHDALKGHLWEPDGTKWECHFGAEHLEELATSWMKNVEITGRAIENRGKRIIQVDMFTIIEAPMHTTAHDFWKSVGIEDLASSQGVAPVTNLDEIGRLWPMDDDPDELINYITRDRAERRSMADGDHDHDL